jgi:penicillin amidase
MKILRIVLLVILVIVAVVVLGGVYLYNDWTRGVLPQHSGELTVAGLNDRVEIIRDGLGIPHIYASTSHDLFFAQGYTQAQDRWWQMEFFRHIGNGAIQELTGQSDSLTSTDVFIRTIGWRRSAERDLAALDEETTGYLQAFADGVNAYIGSRAPGDLAFEYNVLGLTGVSFNIAPWTPVDTLVFAKIMAWDLGNNRDRELERTALYDTIGQEMTDFYIPAYPYDQHPTMIHGDELPADAETSLEKSPEISAGDAISTIMAGNVPIDTSFIFGHGSGIGSNNWVVSGSLTESGSPLLANDPHLGIRMPSIWYEIGLHCQPLGDTCPFDVIGFAFAQSAGVIIGHNQNIAWGITTLNLDLQDTYRITVNPDNPLQYEWNGEWRDMTTYDETIQYGDGGVMTIQVRETHLGPILNDNRIDPDTGEPTGFNNENPLALRWVGLDNSSLFKSVLMVDRASNWDEFREALQYWDIAPQNFVYADVEGNIGYQSTGHMPYRVENHSGLTPVDGATDAFEWQGFIPWDYMPNLYNPERGFIVTANEALIAPEYYDWLTTQLGEGNNYVFSQDWDYGYRSQRINDLIVELAPHTAETFAQIQGDNLNLSAQELVPFLAELQFDSADVASARDWLLTWDYRMDMDSPQAALYAQFWMRLVNNLYDDQLEAAGYNPDDGGRGQWVTLQLMSEPDNVWWDNITTEGIVETRDDILARSLTEAYSNTVAALGSNRDTWRWGALHTSTFVSTPLGESGIDLIEGYVNSRPAETSGCGDCVNATNYVAARSDATVNWIPSMRMIIDLSDLTLSQTMHSTGQSGHPASNHYADMIDSWRNIQYHPMLWTREQVDGAAAQTLVLNPSS